MLNLLEVAGLASLTIAGFLVAVALGFAVLGIGLLALARGLA
jgi:hypothetical protein